MTNNWTNQLELQYLPRLLRSWVWWCQHGPKRNSQGTVGGNLLFSLCRGILRHWPYGNDNLYPVYSTRRGMTIVIDLLDFEAYQHTVGLFSGGCAESAFQSMFLREGSTFIDVGANHGAYSLLGAKWVGASGRIFAIEPQPRLAEAIRQSCVLNSLSNVLVEQSAISNQNGESDFYLSTSSSGTASLFNSEKKGGKPNIRVRTETLDDFAKRHEINEIRLVKVDAEGSEGNVFRGAGNVFTEFRPYVWFEFNPNSLLGAGEHTTALIDILKSYGYKRFLNLSAVVSGNVQKASTLSHIENVVAVHEDRECDFEAIISRRRSGEPVHA